MAVRNIMVLFSSNVGAFARDMQTAAAATQGVERAGIRLATVQQSQAISSQKFAISQEESALRIGKLQEKQLVQQKTAQDAAATQNLAMQRGESGAFVSNTSAEGQKIINEAKRVEAAQTEAALVSGRSIEKEKLAMQSKNLAAQQSAQSVITASKAETAAIEQQAAAREHAITQMAHRAVLVGAIGVAAITETIHLAAQFESQMAQAAAISDTTRQHLDLMSTAILRIGAVAPVSLEELTKGLVSAEQAGFQGYAALSMVKLGAEGAVVGMTDASSAIKGISTVLTGFSLGVGEAVNVNNLLIAAVKNGLGTYGSFADALTEVGPAARMAGVSVNDAAAAIAVMTKRGLSAQTAATGIGRILVQLAREGTPAERALTGLANAQQKTAQGTHAMTFENGEAVVKGLGLVRTLKLIGDATGSSLTKLEQFIPNIRQIRASLALLDGGGRDVAAMVALFSNRTKLAELAAKSYATQLGTTTSQMQLMKNNLQEAGITIGQTFLPIANELIQWVTNLAKGFQDLAPWAQKAIEIFIGGGAGLLLFAGILGTLRGAYISLSTAVKGAMDVLTGANAEKKAADAALIETRQTEITQMQEVIAGLRAEMAAMQEETVVVDGLVTSKRALIATNAEEATSNEVATGTEATRGVPLVPGGGGGAASGLEEVAPIAGVGMLSRAGTFAKSGLGMTSIGLLAGQAGFYADRHLSGAPGRAAGIFGDVATGAGLGAGVGLLGGPLAPVTSTTGAIVGGTIGLAKGLFNLASGGGSKGPSGDVKAWMDALKQEQSGTTGMGQQQLFQNFAQSGAFTGIDKMGTDKRGSGSALSDISNLVMQSGKNTETNAAVYREFARSLDLTEGKYRKLGITEKESIGLDHDVKSALTGNVDAAERVRSKYEGLAIITDGLATRTRSGVSTQILSAQTLKTVSEEVNKHNKALAENKKQQDALLPVTQANNAMMANMGTMASGAAVDLAKVPPQVKAIVDAFAAMSDPSKAFAAALVDPVNIAMNGTAQFATFQEVFSSTQQKAQDGINQSATKAAKANNDQIAAANSARSFQAAAMARARTQNASLTTAIIGGSRLQSLAIRQGAQEANAAMSAQVKAQNKIADGAKVTAKEIKDSWGNGGVAQVSLAQFSAQMTQTVAEQGQWNADLKKIADRAKAAGLPVSDLLDGLEKLGKSGEGVTHELATGSTQDIAALSLQAESLAKVTKPRETGDQFVTAYKKQLDDAERFKKDLQKVMTATGGPNSLVAQMFLSKKDDPAAAAALHNFAQNLTPKTVQTWMELADRAATSFSQEAAISLSQRSAIVGDAIAELTQRPSELKTASGLRAFWVHVGRASGVSPEDAKKWAQDNTALLIKAVGGQGGIGTTLLKRLLGTTNVNEALQQTPGLRNEILKGLQEHAKEPIKQKISADTDDASRKLKALKKDQAALKVHPGDESLRYRVVLETAEWVKAVNKVEADKKTLLEGDKPKVIKLDADKKNVDSTLAKLQRDIAHGGGRMLIRADTKEWNDAKKKLKDDEKAINDATPGPTIKVKGKDVALKDLSDIKKAENDLNAVVTISVQPSIKGDQPSPESPKTTPVRPGAKTAPTGSGSTANYVLSIDPTTGKTVAVNPITQQIWPVDPKTHKPIVQRDGGIMRFADGGTMHVAKDGKSPEKIGKLPEEARIQRRGTLVQWAEPETGDEAFIPMSMAKRARSLKILHEVAERFGFDITKRFSDGGFSARPPGVAMLGQQRMAAVEPKVIFVQQRVPVSHVEQYEFGDISGPSMKDVQRYAVQKARMKAYRGDN